jgi:hypothetical protein
MFKILRIRKQSEARKFKKPLVLEGFIKTRVQIWRE